MARGMAATRSRFGAGTKGLALAASHAWALDQNLYALTPHRPAACMKAWRTPRRLLTGGEIVEVLIWYRMGIRPVQKVDIRW